MSTRTPLPTVNERDTENHSSVDGFVEPPAPPTKSASRHSLPRCRNSFTSTDEQPHIGNYRLLKTIGKGNFAKVKLARHILTGREVRQIYTLLTCRDDGQPALLCVCNYASCTSPVLSCLCYLHPINLPGFMKYDVLSEY
ncbi:MAP microtubule affinity-regulating kinase 1 [Goodea atripinnis]|uniref:MAP microtubule affinity-regulating kinase 1 n=1 Tax=Goodea atripinnis TaxID=208336 RepID=A0ABV0ML75_9TELE